MPFFIASQAWRRQRYLHYPAGLAVRLFGTEHLHYLGHVWPSLVKREIHQF